MAEKLSKKELKQPDAFQKVGGEARDFLEERGRLVVIVVVLLFLGGGGAALASYLSNRSEEKASQELGQTLKVLSRPVVTVESPTPEGEEPPFKSDKEKDEATRKALAEFRAKYKGTRAADTAALTEADSAYRVGEYEQAIGAYSDYLKGAPADEPLRAAALEGQGYAYEAKGQLDKALESFQQLSKEKSDFETGMGLYHQARILILQSKKEEAAQVLTQLNAAHPGSAAAKLGAERLALLASEGVKIPPPPAGAPDAGH